ncbi:hypothetical protein JTE90_011713 [Oedothorax gibbosus]|uniref:Uncharacterized protein n=1 Tax=Oedothorax gibbosus TaxID=931172 RepID=A0AAV6UVT6_9ARAC|nr:hypothetical protein JTE90_011713 [Oedothorax gibbosus]
MALWNNQDTKARFQVTPVPEEQLLSAPTSPTWKIDTKVRFQVTPVPEEQLLSAPTSPTRRRVSKFLLDLCVSSRRRRVDD